MSENQNMRFFNRNQDHIIEDVAAYQKLQKEIINITKITHSTIDNIPYRFIINDEYMTLNSKYYYYPYDICKLFNIENSDEVIENIPEEYKREFLMLDLKGNIIKTKFINGKAVIRLLIKSQLPENIKDIYMKYIQLQ